MAKNKPIRITPERLLATGICVSMADCRRIISNARISRNCQTKIESLIREKEGQNE